MACEELEAFLNLFSFLVFLGLESPGSQSGSVEGLGQRHRFSFYHALPCVIICLAS